MVDELNVLVGIVRDKGTRDTDDQYVSKCDPGDGRVGGHRKLTGGRIVGSTGEIHPGIRAGLFGNDRDDTMRPIV